MTKNTDIQQTLKIRLEKLQEDLLGIKSTAQPVDLNEPIGRLSRMDAIQQQQMMLNAKKQIEISIEQVKGAFERLAADTYGECIRCGEEIHPNRLKAKPEAILCAECQQEQ